MQFSLETFSWGNRAQACCFATHCAGKLGIKSELQSTRKVRRFLCICTYSPVVLSESAKVGQERYRIKLGCGRGMRWELWPGQGVEYCILPD